MVENYMYRIWQARILGLVLKSGNKNCYWICYFLLPPFHLDLSELENSWCSTLINDQKNDFASITCFKH